MNPNLTNPLLFHHHRLPHHPHPTTSITRLTQLNRIQKQLPSTILIQQQRGQTRGQSKGNCLLLAFCSLLRLVSLKKVKLTLHSSSCALFMLKHKFISTQSDQGQEEYETEEQLHARLLTAALEFVPQHGWSMEAIAAGAEVRFTAV